jgi:hypothetical protein
MFERCTQFIGGWKFSYNVYLKFQHSLWKFSATLIRREKLFPLYTVEDIKIINQTALNNFEKYIVQKIHVEDKY